MPHGVPHRLSIQSHGSFVLRSSRGTVSRHLLGGTASLQGKNEEKEEEEGEERTLYPRGSYFRDLLFSEPLLGFDNGPSL